MTEILRLSAADRVLVLAPHPDDESIACGGLLLAARDAGAARRVIVLTDGDNNPWPQRWIEKRWRIDAAARARWGARRRAEAHAALDVLGVDPAQRDFFGLPDSTLTDVLMRDSAGLIERLRLQIEQFEPTYLVMPVLEDRHPDHSAVHIAARAALLGGEFKPLRCLSFAVHGQTSLGPCIDVPMSAALEVDKQAAIVKHATQMRLSRARFIAFAKGPERYSLPVPAVGSRVDNPLRGELRADGSLRLELNSQALRGKLSDYHLLLLVGSGTGGMLRWRLVDEQGSGTCALLDANDGRLLTRLAWQQAGATQQLSVPLPPTFAARLGYVKLARNRPGLVIYDRYGWQTISVNASEFGNV